MLTDSLYPVITEDIMKLTAADLPWEGLRGSSVLVTGATGTVASYLVFALLHLNDERNLGVRVIALARDPDKAARKMGSAASRRDIEWIYQDVCEPLRYPGDIGYIIHAASPANPKFFASDPAGTIDANVLGARNLLEAARTKGSKKFLFLSSSEVYGKPTAEGLLREEAYGSLDSAWVRSCYPESKRLAETYCAAYAKQYGLACHAVRIAHIYGPSMDRNDGHAIAEFMRCALDGRDIVLKSDGSARRAYVYVSDVASGLFTVLLKGRDMVYNLTNEEQVVSVGELARMIADASPGKGMRVEYDIPADPVKLGFLSYQPGLLSSERLRSLGWKPEVTLKEGIGRTLRVLGG